VQALTDRKVTTLRAQWLGHQLRDLRERSGLSLRQVGEYLKRNFSALSRFENAEWPFPRGDVLQLLDLYGVHDGTERCGRGDPGHHPAQAWRQGPPSHTELGVTGYHAALAR